MTEHDQNRFIDEVMGPLYLAFDKKPDAELSAVYVGGLADLPYEQVREAALKAIRTLTFFPKIAELRALILGTLDDAAVLAWGRVYTACGAGYYQPITFDDPRIHATIRTLGGWSEIHALSFLATESVEVATTRKAFLEAYRAIVRTGVPADTPRAACAGPAELVGDLPAKRIGPHGELSASPEPTKALPGAPLKEIGPLVSELMATLATKHHAPEGIRRVVVERPRIEPLTASEQAELDRRKSEALARFRSVVSA